MQEIPYKTFSLRTHKKNWNLNNPNVCQFELTYGCGLHCKYCYTDCFNKGKYLKKELDTGKVKFILDKVYDAGVIWLCFTGGDPLTRRDFLDIYSYAKDKGFIVTVFTSAYSMTEEIVKYFKERPPFVIEMTLNGVSQEVYERISQAKGSFDKVIQGINLILKAKLPLKIKTQIIRDNFEESRQIKKFIEGSGLKFRPSSDLHARLNGDLAPCNLRVPPNMLLGLDEDKDSLDDNCQPAKRSKDEFTHTSLFRCAIGGGDGIHIDPYGNLFLCNLIRKPSFNLLKEDIKYASLKLLSLVRNQKFTSNSKCDGCSLRDVCHSCPGRAYLETGDMEAPINYYCGLAEKVAHG